MHTHVFIATEGPTRPVTEWLQDALGLAPDSLAVRIADVAVAPALQILLILVLAGVALRVLKRVVHRTVERAKDPHGFQARGLRSRVGFLDEARPVVSARRSKRVDALGALGNSIVSVVIWVVAVFMVLGTFDINLGPLIAGAGVIGIALGFGAQTLVRDFLSGIFMLAEDQYGVGDIVNAGEAIGVVEAVTLRTTKIRDVEGTLWHVPNGEILRVGNMSQGWARALLDVAVAYGTNIDAASELIRRVASEMAHEDEYVDVFLDEPEIWGVQTLGDDSVDIRLVIKTTPGEQWKIARELRRRIKNAFDAAEVEIPFPQRTVWLRTEQPVSFGGPEEPAFDHPIPDEATMRRAIAASKRGDTGAARATSELVVMTEDEADMSPDAEADPR